MFRLKCVPLGNPFGLTLFPGFVANAGDDASAIAENRKNRVESMDTARVIEEPPCA
jgi:hypothetical protein